MQRRFWMQSAALVAVLASGLSFGTSPAWAAEAPDALIQRLSNEVLAAAKTDKKLQSGDPASLAALVDSIVLPNVNFRRMTAAAVGPSWPKASKDQQDALQREFKTLLMRTYSGAMAQATADQTITVRPLRAAPQDDDVLVRSEVRGKGDPVQIDYRLEKLDDGSWKIYNLNVMGVWLVETYRSQFAQAINAGGVDGLIKTLTDRNQIKPAKK